MQCNVLKNGSLYAAPLHNFLIRSIKHEHMGKEAANMKPLVKKI